MSTWDRTRSERPDRQLQHDDGVLATAEEQTGTFELRCDLPHDVDAFGLEGTEVGELVGHRVDCSAGIALGGRGLNGQMYG